ncbi:hypothetical protein V6N13_125501 [Hibiscus sabdariffa]|uniref:Protein kinase domain-containing protein n=1 Tax=Hibiscus sabdariffa TaxID=183260 RepID=A0ABR2U5S7_9ROSI
MSGSPSQPPKFKGEPCTKKHMPPCKFISIVFKSPLRKRKTNLSNKETERPLMKCFSFEQISNATNNFHLDNIVGRGGYLEVYRGDLSDGRSIAVKMLAKENKEKEFLVELGIIGHVCHPNTAKDHGARIILLSLSRSNDPPALKVYTKVDVMSPALHPESHVSYSL